MKGFLKNLGIILIVISALMLICIFCTQSAMVNSNAFLFVAAALVVIGIVLYIFFNKKYVD